MIESFRDYLPEEVRDAQLAEFARERDSVLKERAEACRFIADQLPRDARILCIDVSQDGLKKLDVPEEMMAGMAETQFGEGDRTFPEAFRHLMGLDEDDPRFMVWRAFERPKPKGLPFPDAWLVTGGPAMPSELDPGNKTENTKWLKRAAKAIQELTAANIPGVPVCLGHQLFAYAEGARVGRPEHGTREFGTVDMQATEAGKDLQLLYGFWNEEGNTQVSATHSEGVIVPPTSRDMHVIAFNGYSNYQGFAKPLREGQTVQEADQEDQLVVSLQNHPEVTAMLLSVLRHVRGDAMKAEGLNPDEMIFKDTPNARSIWHNFIELAARRAQNRSK